MKDMKFYAATIIVFSWLSLSQNTKAEWTLKAESIGKSSITFSISGSAPSGETHISGIGQLWIRAGSIGLPLLDNESWDLTISGSPIVGANLYGVHMIDHTSDAGFHFRFDRSLESLAGGGSFTIASAENIPIFDTANMGEFLLYWGRSSISNPAYQSTATVIPTKPEILIRTSRTSRSFVKPMGFPIVELWKSTDLRNWQRVENNFNLGGDQHRFYTRDNGGATFFRRITP
ncbi:MAG: hypothetical protein ACI9R3_004065 [Verrucomicrobiales bacterium]|jgi:hypothetical protein